MDRSQKKRVVTIGNFDGVHLGHKYLIDKIKNQNNSKSQLDVLTFEPHPQEFIEGRLDFILMETEEKRHWLKEAGVDEVNVLNFNNDIRCLSAEGFLKKFVIDSGDVESLYIGYDFKFGKNKEGDFSFASEYCAPYSINVYQTDYLTYKDTIVSSSHIRSLLKHGDCLRANEFLGRSYKLNGKIIHGQGRGRTIGFPTTNLEIHKRRLVPQNGVYVTSAKINNVIYNSISNVGVNPTFSNAESIKIETHHFGLAQDVYGMNMELLFLEKIRNEVKFNSALDLGAQIAKDVSFALEKHEKIRPRW